MKTYFVVSDIHSFYNEFIEALNLSGFDKNNEEHILISLGDACDRGPDSVSVLSFLLSLPKNRRILILGNHEDLMNDAIKRQEFLLHDLHNKTNRTVFQLTNEFFEPLALKMMKTNELWNNYIESCVDFYELGKYVFVHGWIPNTYDDNWKTGSWLKARWYNCFDEWHKGNILKNKVIVAGHIHTSYGHSKYHNNGCEFYDDDSNKLPCFDIFYDEGIIAIDACTAYTKKVNVLVLHEEDL